MSLAYLQALRAAAQPSAGCIESMPVWEPSQLALYFRQATMAGTGLDAVVLLPHEPIDLTTFTLVDPERDAPLHTCFQAASNAADAAQLLFENVPGTFPDKTLRIARRLYIDAVVLRAQGTMLTHALGIAPPSVNDFKRMAIRCMLQLGDPAPERPWDQLIAADARWALAAPVQVRARLHSDFPQTRPWLDAFELQLQFFPATQSLDKIWALQAPKMPSPEERAVLALPDLGM